MRAETRLPDTEKTRLTEAGALTALYRRVGPKAKVGVGSESGRAPDDPADATPDARGGFLNIVASV